MRRDGFAASSVLLGILLASLLALTTDQIMQKVYDSSNTALRVNVVSGGGAATSITSGTTTISSGADKSICFDDGGVINCGSAPLSYDKVGVTLNVGVNGGTGGSIIIDNNGYLLLGNKSGVNVISLDSNGLVSANSLTSRQGTVNISAGGGTVSVVSTSGTYNFNLPTTAGSAGQPMISGAGGSTPMGWAAGITDTGGTITLTEPLTTNNTITSSRTSDIGWSLQSAANQACNTTCTSACVIGQDTSNNHLVACTDAAADLCICAGAS